MKRTRSNPSTSIFRGSSNQIDLGRRITSCNRRSYDNDLWPKISAFLNEIFLESDDKKKGIDAEKKGRASKRAGKVDSRSDSFEECYRLVYSCVLHSYGERLANDLFKKIGQEIQSVSSKTDDADAVDFIFNFYAGVNYLLLAFERVQGIFLYFDRHFLLPKMGFRGLFLLSFRFWMRKGAGAKSKGNFA